MPATLIIAPGEEREGWREGEKEHIEAEYLAAGHLHDVEESDIYSTAGGTAGQPATGELTGRRRGSEGVNEL